MTKRIGRLLYEDSADVGKLSSGEQAFIEGLLNTNIENITMWREEDLAQSPLMVETVEDGLRMIGSVDFDGNLIGDWIV